MLSVVIPTMNRPDSLIRLVTSLQLQSIAPESYEVLVIYNTEADKKTSPIQNHSHCKVLCAPKPGVNHARNHGAVHSSGNLVLFLDDDCEVVDPHFLQKHIDYHQQFTELIAVGGPYFLKPQASVCDRIYQQNNLNWIAANLSATSRSTALLGGNASYKSFIFQKGFRFTEEISYGGSETPLNTLLALKYGPHGYFQDLKVLHNTRLNFYSLLHKAYRQGIGAALQTKIYGHQLKQVAVNTSTQPFFVNLGLELYALVFTIGYQSQLSQRNLLWIFLKTLWVRYINKKIIATLQTQITRLYWWQHSRLRHPMLIFISKAYWALYSFLYGASVKLYWSSRHVFLRFLNAGYWAMYRTVMQIHGFLETLFEPLPVTPQTLAAHRLVLRLRHIAKKMGWLFLRTVRLK